MEQVASRHQQGGSQMVSSNNLASVTCLQKTGSETGFPAQNLDRQLDKDFQGRISDRKAEQIFKSETGFLTGPKTGSKTGQGTLFC